MNKIILSENHTRSVSSSLYIIEKTIEELEREIISPPKNRILYKIDKSDVDIDLVRFKSLLSQIKMHIRYLTYKYNLHSTNLHLDRIIASHKSKIWEILCATTAKGLKGYGAFPEEYSEEFDSDIDTLQRLIDNI